MHTKDDLLRSYMDHELPTRLTSQVEEHLARCATCRQNLETMIARAESVQSRLDLLAPGTGDQARSTRAAYQRFTSSSHLATQRKESIKTMFTRRPLWAAIAVFAVLALVFTLTPARAWASSLLSLFRVQKVQVITFDPTTAENAYGKLEANQSAIEQVFKEDAKITEHGKITNVASPEEAAQKAGFTPRLPADLTGATLSVKPGMDAVFTIHQEKLQTLAEAVGVDVQIPASVDGKVITVNVPNAVAASYGCSSEESVKRVTPENCTSLLEMPSPTINAPDGLDVPKMGEAMFRFLGVPASEAQQLSQKIDWTTTLVLPIPQNGKIEYQDVQVDGVNGTLLKGGGFNGSMLIWVKDGILYGLRVPGSQDDALKLAGTLK